MSLKSCSFFFLNKFEYTYKVKRTNKRLHNDYFSDKNVDIFLIFALCINCGHLILEPSRESTINVLSKIKESNNRGIKHDFPFINICKVPREVLKTEGEARGFSTFPRDLANVNE